MPIDASIYGLMGRGVGSIGDYQEQQQRIAANALLPAIRQQQLQQSQQQLDNERLQYQLQSLGLQQKQTLLNALLPMLQGGQGQSQGMSPSDALAAGAANGSVGPTVANANRLAAGSTPGYTPGNTPAGSGNPGGFPFSLRQITGLKALGGPDLSAEFKMALDGGQTRAPGSTWIDANGQTHYAPKLGEGQVLDNSGNVVTLPGYNSTTAATTAATEGAKLGAQNAQTLAPLDRIDPTTNRPYAGTVADLINAVHGGNPLQQELDAAKAAGPQGVAQIRAKYGPQILAIQDPQQRQQAWAHFEADLASPQGTPVAQGAQGVAQGQQGQLGTGTFAGFAGPADIAGAKAQAEAGVKAKTQPGIDFSTANAKNAAEYGNALDNRVLEGSDLMTRVNTMRDALNQFNPGMDAPARLQVARAMQAAGVPDSIVKKVAGGDVGAMQEFDKISAQSAMASLRQAMGTSGRMTQAEFKVFLANNPSIALSRPAMDAIFNFMQQQYQRDYSEQQSRAQYLQNGGDPAQWRAVWSTRLDPTGTGQIGTPAPPGAAPAPAMPTGPKVASEADIQATMRSSGRTRAQVVQALQSKGYRVQSGATGGF